MNGEPDWISEVVSVPRFAPYLTKTSGDLRSAIDLYWWNIAASAAFYAPLQCLEVALRNCTHRQLTGHFERSDWWEVAPLNRSGLRIVSETREKLVGRGRAYTADDMVAEFSFGFWVSLVSGAYHRDLWVPVLHRAFPRHRQPRRALHADLRTVLLFRNRIMHHEPIHHRHLEADHATIIRMIGTLSPSMVDALVVYDTVGAVLSRRPASGSRGRLPGDGDAGETVGR